MIEEKDVIEALNEVIEKYLKPKFISLGMNASGQWLDSLEVLYDNGQGQIWGADYSYYLAKGRKGGSMPPITPLIKWVNDKFGISGKEAKSFAFAIAKKIEREGTDYYPNGTDLLEVLESKEVMDFLSERFKIQIGLNLQKQLKRIIDVTFKN